MRFVTGFVLLLCVSALHAQDTVAAYRAKIYYDKGMALAKEGNLEGAIKLLDQSIGYKNDEYVVWYNRGIAKTMLRWYEEAIPDFNECLKLQPDYKRAYLNRGTARMALTDYPGAISDYNHAIELDPTFADAFYDRGLVYEKLQIRDTACRDFQRAKEMQMAEASKKTAACDDTGRHYLEVHSVLRLEKQSTDPKYGFTEKNPVKVGMGPVSGPANERDYLDLLRDAKGKPVKYTRLESCCGYKSANGIFGTAMLDKYQIIYTDAAGAEQKKEVYISFYDYEEPQILSGFSTVKIPVIPEDLK